MREEKLEAEAMTFASSHLQSVCGAAAQREGERGQAWEAFPSFLSL